MASDACNVTSLTVIPDKSKVLGTHYTLLGEKTISCVLLVNFNTTYLLVNTKGRLAIM